MVGLAHCTVVLKYVQYSLTYEKPLTVSHINFSWKSWLNLSYPHQCYSGWGIIYPPSECCRYNFDPTSCSLRCATRVFIGPLLFIFYVDDINGVNVSEKGSITLYADDICYTHPVTAAFQQDIDKIGSWATSSKLTFNESKTVWMLISKKQHQHFASVDIHLNGKRIDWVNEVRYLGVVITDDLTWSAHIQTVVQKARRKLGYIYRTFYKNCSTEVLLNLYKSLIQYCCLVWDPSSK